MGRLGRLDLLVNNAGLTIPTDYSELNKIDESHFDRIFGLNVRAPFFLAQALAPMLKKAQGAIVNVSSTSAICGKGSSLVYAASKGAISTMTLGLAHALAPEVRVTAICPGFVDSSWFDGLESRNQLINAVKGGTLLNRVAKPDDCGHLIVAMAENQMLN